MTTFDEKIDAMLRRAKMKFHRPAKEDLVNVLTNFKDLQPEISNFVFPDNGISRECFTLSGTVPVHYKGGKYNIPVALYFLDNHPYKGPYCYVKPTSNMRIRDSQTVDTKGRFYSPYLTDWAYPSHDTPGLIQVMILSFQEKCPVYSVNSSTPLSTNNHHHSQHSSSASTTPPYPTRNAPPTPPYPSAGSNAANPPYPVADPPPHLMPQPNVAMGSCGYPPPAHFQQAAPPYPTSNSPTPTGHPPPVLGSGYGYGTGTIQPTHIRASLLSAVEDRIRQKLCDKIGTPFAELESIDANLRELHNGKQTLREMMDSIARDQAELDRIRALYTSKKEELQRAIDAATAHGTGNGKELNAEDAIDAQTPVHRQILRCYVQDCAIDDTIYCLGQALKQGTINLQTYLKFVRQLSHQQFQHRLLMQKCRERTRLPV